MIQFSTFWKMIPVTNYIVATIHNGSIMEYGYYDKENVNLRLYQDISTGELVAVTVYDPKEFINYVWEKDKEAYPLNLINYNNQKSCIELTVLEDIFEKSEALVNHKEYDKRIMVDVEIDEDVLQFIYKEAHKMDITVNQYINNVMKGMKDELRL